MARPEVHSGAINARDGMARALLGGQPRRLSQISADLPAIDGPV
jgi:hypothetical protein